MINHLDTITEEIIEEENEQDTRKIRRFFKIGGCIFLVSGITTLIIGLTSGIALIPIIIGGYLTINGIGNLVIKI